MSLLLAPPTIEKLHALHWTDMAQSWEAQRHLPDIDTLSFEESLGLLLDAESATTAVCRPVYAPPRCVPPPAGRISMIAITAAVTSFGSVMRDHGSQT